MESTQTQAARAFYKKLLGSLTEESKNTMIAAIEAFGACSKIDGMAVATSIFGGKANKVFKEGGYIIPKPFPPSWMDNMIDEINAEMPLKVNFDKVHELHSGPSRIVKMISNGRQVVIEKYIEFTNFSL